MSKLWTCPFCMQRNHFPPHYAENISETNLPYELIPQFTTVEYELTTPPHGPPAFVFCVDTCVSEDELDELKDSLQQVRWRASRWSSFATRWGGMACRRAVGASSGCPKSLRGTATPPRPANRPHLLLNLNQSVFFCLLFSSRFFLKFGFEQTMIVSGRLPPSLAPVARPFAFASAAAGSHRTAP